MRTLSLGIVLLLCGTVAGAQGLGGAAAKEKQRRAAQPSHAKVISQADLDAAAARREGWTSPDGAFKVGFPGQPEVVDNPVGGTTYRIKAGTTALLVNVRSTSGAELETVTAEVRGAALGSLGDATIASERSVATGRGVPGREFVINFTGRSTARPGVMTNRVFVSNGQMYLVTAVAEASDGGSTGSAFLDSFEVLK